MRTRVCPQPGCPNLVSAREPCPEHGRRNSDPWSKHRPREWRGKQHKLRMAALERSGYSCERCGHQDPSGKSLQVHHLRGADDFRLEHATALCIPCHVAIDSSARDTRRG